MARTVYLACVAIIVAVHLAAGLADLALWLGDRPTMSSWLRDHPQWFLWPAVVNLVLLAWLTVHLFFRE